LNSFINGGNTRIKIVNIISEEVYEVEHNLNYFVHGQGGLLDIIYQDNYLWISYSENRGDWKTSTSIAKAKLNKKNLDFKNIFLVDDSIVRGITLKNIISKFIYI